MGISQIYYGNFLLDERLQDSTAKIDSLIIALAPSSRGLGHYPLKVETRVRIPLGLPNKLWDGNYPRFETAVITT